MNTANKHLRTVRAPALALAVASTLALVPGTDAAASPPQLPPNKPRAEVPAGPQVNVGKPLWLEQERLTLHPDLVAELLAIARTSVARAVDVEADRGHGEAVEDGGGRGVAGRGELAEADVALMRRGSRRAGRLQRWRTG